MPNTELLSKIEQIIKNAKEKESAIDYHLNYNNRDKGSYSVSMRYDFLEQILEELMKTISKDHE